MIFVAVVTLNKIVITIMIIIAMIKKLSDPLLSSDTLVIPVVQYLKYYLCLHDKIKRLQKGL